jgi:hypothetical protein
MIFLFGLKFLLVKHHLFCTHVCHANFFCLGGEADYIWTGPSWYGTMFEEILKQDLGSDSEIDKIKVIFSFKRFSSIHFIFFYSCGMVFIQKNQNIIP